MKKNMGNADRVIRLLVAVFIVYLYTQHVITGITALVLLAIAGIFTLTTVVGVCPLYLPFGIHTNKKN